MDNSYLRMIANPYLLKKSNNRIKTKDYLNIENTDLLYQYLEIKYKDIYINPILFYDIMQKIDELIKYHEIELIIDEIVGKTIEETIEETIE